MTKYFLNSLVALKQMLKKSDLTQYEREGIEFALEFMREYEFRHNETIEKVGNMYIPMMGDGTYAFDGYNAAIRDVLNVLDPKKERYKKGA